MIHKPVKSSNIQSIGYDAETHKMQVTFSNGGIYEYEKVSPAEHQAFAEADSHGSHFAKHVRPHFVGKKLK